jgi:hypothetical protein
MNPPLNKNHKGQGQSAIVLNRLNTEAQEENGIKPSSEGQIITEIEFVDAVR